MTDRDAGHERCRKGLQSKWCAGKRGGSANSIRALIRGRNWIKGSVEACSVGGVPHSSNFITSHVNIRLVLSAMTSRNSTCTITNMAATPAALILGEINSFRPIVCFWMNRITSADYQWYGTWRHKLSVICCSWLAFIIKIKNNAAFSGGQRKSLPLSVMFSFAKYE